LGCDYHLTPLPVLLDSTGISFGIDVKLIEVPSSPFDPVGFKKMLKARSRAATIKARCCFPRGAAGREEEWRRLDGGNEEPRTVDYREGG